MQSLNEDISFIENQKDGLQVQTSNQKILQLELKNLLETVSVNSRQLEPLRRAPIGKSDGLMAIEAALLLLYKAMITIDPSIGKSSEQAVPDKKRISGLENSELSSMKALHDKRERYIAESAMFVERLTQFLDTAFKSANSDSKGAMLQFDSGSSPRKLDVRVHDIGRNTLWNFSPLLLFVKEIDMQSWEVLMKMYQSSIRTFYQDELEDNISGWKKQARKPTGEEADVLFTTQEKGGESLSGTARKLTVKRSQTLAKSLRSANGDKTSAADRSRAQSGRCFAFEAFAGALEEATPLIFTEQNFIVDFFHASSSEHITFVDVVNSGRFEDRTGTDVYATKHFESDRAMAKMVQEVMEELFFSWPNEMQSMIDWAIRTDPL